MAQDEFLLWVKQDAPYQDRAATISRPRPRSGDFKMGGAQSKDTDETADAHDREGRQRQAHLYPVQERRRSRRAARRRPCRLATSTIPSESIGQWRGGTQRPLCVFNPKRLPDGPKVTATAELARHADLRRSSGLDIPQFQQPRTVWLPGKVTPDQAAFYVDLMKKVQAHAGVEGICRADSQTNTFLTGDAFANSSTEDLEHVRKVAAEQGWLVAK